MNFDIYHICYNRLFVHFRRVSILETVEKNKKVIIIHFKYYLCTLSLWSTKFYSENVKFNKKKPFPTYELNMHQAGGQTDKQNNAEIARGKTLPRAIGTPLQQHFSIA